MGTVRKFKKDINWLEVQKDNDNGLNNIEICNKYGFSRTLLESAEKNNLIKLKLNKYKCSEEGGIKISNGIKNYYKENPDKHPWKKNDKFKSKPCEIFKEKLKENQISFVEEYNPIPDRQFSIDIAFPDKNIGIEINGNQHYNSDGSLKEYYQQRHNQIVSSGWTIYEYHYSLAFDNELMNQIINQLKTDYNLGLIDYSFLFYVKQPKKSYRKKNKCVCGNEKEINSILCRPCSYLKKKIYERPDIEILLKEIEGFGYKGTGRKYGVSDNTIKRWLGDKAPKIRTKERRVGKPKCLGCQKEIYYDRKRCKECDNKSRLKVEKPDIEILRKEYKENGAKWCRNKYLVGKTTIYRWLKDL